MRLELQFGLQTLLFPLIVSVATGQVTTAPSHTTGALAGGPTPPAALGGIFGSSFASRLASADTATVSITQGGVVPVYSSSTTIQPGSWISIFGQNLGTGNFTWTGNFPQGLGGTSVTINGKPAYLWFVSSQQINAQAPDDTATGTVPVVVQTPTGSATSTVTLGQFGPSFCELDTGHVAGIIIRSNGTGAYGNGSYDIIGPAGSTFGYPTVPAAAGDTIELYGVGFGPTNPPVPAGQPFSGSAPAVNPVTIFINGTSITPAYAGITSAGLFQFNLTIPAGLGTGDMPLLAMVGGMQTPTGVVISLQ